MKILNFFTGYKTFIAGFCAVVYGIYTKDAQLIFTGIGLVTLRQALTK